MRTKRKDEYVHLTGDWACSDWFFMDCPEQLNIQYLYVFFEDKYNDDHELHFLINLN